METNKKIIFLAYKLGYGKLLYWDAILIAIKKEYPKFRVFTATTKLTTSDSKLETEKLLSGLKIHYKKSTTNGFLLYLPLPFFLIKIKKDRPDLIILNEFNLNSLYLCLFKFFLKNIKILLLVESDPFVGYENKHSNFRNFIRKIIIKKSDKILTNNKLGEEYLVSVLNTSPNKVIVAPYLISNPPIPKDLEYLVNDKIYFLFVGQVIQRKGLIYVLEAIEKLDINTKNKIQFDIIGKGDELLKLEQYKLDHNLDCGNILGYVNYSNLALYYENADCFIINTLHDYRALVGFEALNSGCAIIGSKYDGARFEIIHDGLNGFICDPENINKLTRAIYEITNNDKLREEFKKYSKHLSKKFTVKKGVENIINVLNII